jgi:nucleoside-diphosphate-sugar epimerase
MPQVIAFSPDRRQLRVQRVAAPKVLITGATGFVGSHVVENLARAGHPIRALVRATSDTSRLAEHGAELVHGGLHDAGALGRAVQGVDVIVHLAALTHARSAAELHRANETGTRDLVAAALGAEPGPRRFVYLSSLAAAGPSRNGRPVTVEDAPRPLTAYGRSKLAGEFACLAAADLLDVVVLRAPAVYGPRDRELLRFFQFANRGILPVPSGPARPLQLVHAHDLARAIERAVNVPGVRGTMHIADPQAYDWETVARLIARAVDTSARVLRVPGAAIIAAATVMEFGTRLTRRSSIFNLDKAKELLAPGWLCETEGARAALGFVAGIRLPEGLRETARWYRDHRWL